MKNLEKYGITERFRGEATMYEKYIVGRIMAQHRGLYKVITDQGEIPAEISGKLRHETTELVKFPTVGDYVMVAIGKEEGNGIIHHVLSRKSLFLRTAVGVSGQGQSVAANIDIVFICMSLNNNFNMSRLERYLGVAWDSGATPVILLTKADLCENLNEKISEVELASSFCDVVALSSYYDNVFDKLKKFLKKGITAAFIGSSGVGKSTIVNKLLGEDVLSTADISKDDKGRHTTTGREMFALTNGSVIIDTPGMRELGAEGIDLQKTFDDIEAIASQCKFHDCTHQGEPGCAIEEALLDGSLDTRRYENYTKLKIEAGYEGLNSREIETKKLDRMLKDAGGMKNMRKFAKEQRKLKG